MNAIKIIAANFLTMTFRSRIVTAIYIVWLLLVLYASWTAYISYKGQNELRIAFQQKARKSWEDNPDKHPHRMAHFGTFAFRAKHPLSMFDYGMESYTGNAIFLEAHKQNTVNFSEAGFSTGLLRFGTVSLSMLLQVLLPLIIFFLGFGTVAQQRENGTLKILLGQGVSFRQIIWGNAAGLFVLSILFLLPVIIAGVITVVTAGHEAGGAAVSSRSILLLLVFILLLWISGVIAVCISAMSAGSREALLKLLGIWLLMVILIPRTLQAVAGYVYPTPGKIQFETAVEADILKTGDSHNPNDPHFKRLKDSVLAAHHVDSVQQLPFNYSGFQMQEGERMSAAIYNRHQEELFRTYEQQNRLNGLTSFVNPVLAFKDLSMSLSGTDFNAYRHFQNQAETYRYKLAQTMNELQIKYISNAKPVSDDQPHSIEKHHWTAFPDFRYQYLTLSDTLRQNVFSIASSLLWFILSFLLISFTAAKAKAI